MAGHRRRRGSLGWHSLHRCLSQPRLEHLLRGHPEVWLSGSCPPSGACALLGCCTPRGAPAFPGRAQAPRLASSSASSPGPRTHCWRGRGPESGQEPLALLIGSVAFCSVFGLPAIQRAGPGSLPVGSTQTAAPTPWGPGPGPSWHLEDVLLADRARAGRRLVASQSHPNHTGT